MRVVQNQQMQLGEVDIAGIRFNPKSRDDIPKILKGLQYLYVQEALRNEIFALLEARFCPNVDKRNGRPGMALWTIFVCGVLRLDLDMDYDRLHELVNHHDTIRQMLGHGPFNETEYEYETLMDNVQLFTPELLDEINQLVVNAGHALLKKKVADEALRGRCDSFVVKTDVHFPTDISLLFDAMRKVIELIATWCRRCGMSDWRQSAYNVKHLKRLMRVAQNKKRSKAKSDELKLKNEAAVILAHQEYLTVAKQYLSKAQETLAKLGQQENLSENDARKQKEIENFMQHAARQIDQTKRRVIDGETIAHAEKVFSVFEPHTEWISKGKAGVPVELGVKVCILEDQHQFILHHQVMQKQTDDQVAVLMVLDAKKRFPKLNACSFDKGFHSPENQTQLQQHLEQVTLPRKGKLSQQARAIEHAEAFVKARRAHSAVESAINGLGVHGLDKCRDHGIEGFKRHVAFAIVARNIHRIGAILWQQEQECLSRKNKRSAHAPPFKKAA